MLLSVENISVHFGKRPILDNVSLKVGEGKIIALTGKSGSGKTTMLGIISGLLSPDSGKVIYRNKNILKWGDFRKSRFRNKEIGFIFQFFNLLPDMTSYQNIRYPTILRLFPRDVDGEIQALAKHLNITEILNNFPTTLSGGERQRVAIARAVINHPKILLADEPTGNLDVETAKGIRELFVRLKKEDNLSIILVTHDRTLVDIADEHYHLDKGKLYKMKKGEIFKERKTIKRSTEKKPLKTKTTVIKKTKSAKGR